jgi:hypothetical protein
MTKAQLVAKAKGLKIEFDEVIATKGDIILEIEKAEEKLAFNKPESTHQRHQNSFLAMMRLKTAKYRRKARKTPNNPKFAPLFISKKGLVG